MATTSNFSWATPDDTANVKDGAAAIRSLGTAIDTTVATMVPKTVVDAKGDIIAATAADTVSRLAVGANDTVLTADSSAATGLKWGTISAGGMTSIATGSFSTATTNISSISQSYKNLVLVVRGVSTNGNEQLRIRFNSDTSSIYGHTYVVSNTSSVNTSSAIGYVDLSGASTLLAAGPHSFIFTMHDYTASRDKVFDIIGTTTRPGPSTVGMVGMGFYDTNTAISSIQFVLSGGTYAGGTYILYGVN